MRARVHIFATFCHIRYRHSRQNDGNVVVRLLRDQHAQCQVMRLILTEVICFKRASAVWLAAHAIVIIMAVAAAFWSHLQQTETNALNITLSLSSAACGCYLTPAVRSLALFFSSPLRKHFGTHRTSVCDTCKDHSSTDPSSQRRPFMMLVCFVSACMMLLCAEKCST